MPSESKFSVRGSTSSKTKKVASDRDEELKALLKASNELQEKIASILDARAADDKLPKDEVKEANPDSSDSSSSSDEDNSSESGMSSGAYSRKSSTSSLQSNRHRLALLREAKQPRTYIDHHMTRRLIKELNIKESFNPRHEKAYDDQLDLLERLTRAKGFEVNLLPQVITSVADDNVLYRINKYELHHIHEWSKFRDRLAKKLYPYSNEIDIVAQSLSEPEDREDAEDLVMWFEKTVQRYHMLRRRWKHPNAFHNHQLKQALLNKLCAPLQAEAMRSDWRQWDLDRFIQFVLKCNDDLARRQRRRGPKIGLVAAVPVRDMPMQVGNNTVRSSVRSAISRFNQHDPNQFYEAGEIPETPRTNVLEKNPITYPCRWCKSPQHGSRDCPTKPTCKVCGKKGHDESSCYRVTRQGKLATQQITFTNTPQGMVVNMKEDSSNLAVLEGLSKYFNDACERVKEAKSKAAARKAETATENSRLAGAVNVTTDEESGGLYGKFLIGNTDIVCLVDPGADKNIMNWKTLENLPIEYKCQWKPIEEGQMTLNFVQGSCAVTGSIELPVTSPLGNVEMEFYIVKEARLNILGNPWMRALKAAVCFKEDEVRNEVGKLSLFTKDIVPYSDAFSVTTKVVDVNVMADLQQNFGKQLTDEVKSNIITVLERYSEVWQTTRVACSKNFIYRIDTGDASPIVEPHRHFAPKTLEELKRLTRDLLQAGAIRKSNSNWLSQPVIVSKKDGSSRLCVDFRSLNTVTKADPFNAPDAAAVIRQLGHARIFIVMDLKNSFNQMRIHPDDRCKTAFWTPLGQMEWLGVPFGLLNGTSALARWLYLNVIDLEGVAVYVDDIVIHADDETTLLKYFEAMMKRLHEIGAYINVTKCKFGVDEIEFLGFNIKGGRLTPPRESIKAINAIKLPHDTTTIRRFLGMVGYFRNFIKDFANIAGPLYELLQKEVTFKMTDERISAFHLLQKALSECPGLANPHPSWPYVLDTDASTTAIGACLMQLDENNCLHPVRFGSRRLTPAERNWPIYELEGFAVVHFILAFRPYLIGRTFTVRSDHKPLQWLWKIDKPRLARWSMALQQFDFKIVYNPGTAQEQVDIFTRDVDFTTADEYVDRHLGMVNVEKPVEDRAARQLERLVGDEVTSIPVKTRSSVDTTVIPNLVVDNNFPTIEDFVDAAKEVTPVPDGCIIQEKLLVQAKSGLVYVPEKLRARILFYYHYSRVGAHQGAQKMIVRIKKHFYWPLLAKDCVDFTAGCLTCQRRMNVVNLVGKGVLLSTDFNILVSVDAIGPFMYKKKSYNLITMIDNLTKWVEVGILEDGTALTAWNLVYSMWICRLGVPMKMLTDNGAMFTGRDFCDKVESLGIRTSNATPQYPQGNSMVESFHHFLKGALSRTSVNNWSFEEVLASVLYAYRSTPHISTGESPYRLLTGNDMVLPHFQAWTNYETLDSRAAHRYSLITQLRYEAFEQAISRQALTSTKKDDRKFELGDVVIYQLTKKDSEKLVKYYGTDKLMPAWSEPMRITKVLHPQQGTYLLESVWHKGFKRQVNKTQLRSFYPMPDPRFDEWYRTEAARDRQYQTQGSAAEQQRRERLETAEKLGVRDERGRFVGGERALGVAVERDTHDWLYPGSKFKDLIIPPDSLSEKVSIEQGSQTDKTSEAKEEEALKPRKRRRKNVNVVLTMLPNLHPPEGAC